MLALTIARLVIVEAFQRRVFQVVVVMVLLLLALSAWTFTHLAGLGVRLAPFAGLGSDARPVASQLLILLMYLWSTLFAVTAAFLGAAAIAGEVETGDLLTVLTRPIRRAEFILGRWLGLGVLVGACAAVTTGAQMVLAFVTTGHVPADAPGVILFVAVEVFVILTLALALGTRLSAVAASIGTILAFGLSWTGGVIGGIGSFAAEPILMQVSTATKLLLPSDAVWRAALLMLERPGGLFSGARSVTMGANPFGSEDASPGLYLVVAAVWIAVVLAAALQSFRTRDL